MFPFVLIAPIFAGIYFPIPTMSFLYTYWFQRFGYAHMYKTAPNKRSWFMIGMQVQIWGLFICAFISLIYLIVDNFDKRSALNAISAY